MNNNIVICGFMGAGKSKLGMLAAQKLGLEFYDLDKIISNWYGDSITNLFLKEGESFFRTREQGFLNEYLQKGNRILSLGGGTLQSAEQAEVIKRSNLLIFIQTPFHVIIQRIVGDKRRPLVHENNGVKLEPADVIKKLHALYEKRLPVYMTAHLTFVPKDNWPVQVSVRHLLLAIKEHS